MTVDRRELCLSHLLSILGSVEGVSTVLRNEKDISGSKRPGIILMDQDDDTGDVPQGRPPSGPEMVSMTPEVRILVGGTSAEVGPALNAIRLKIIEVVKNDSQWPTILTTNGAVRFLGSGTELARGRNMSGEMVLSFMFTYPLRRDDWTTVTEEP